MPVGLYSSTPRWIANEKLDRCLRKHTARRKRRKK